MSTLPSIVIYTVPVPFLILLLIITLYHLTPLLSLLPNIHLVPLLHQLSHLIPRPKRNLPREFFNLPPRPGTPSTQTTALDDLRVLSVRVKLVLVLSGHALFGLACGWAYLSEGGMWLLPLSTLGLPSVIPICGVYSLHLRFLHRRGITHSTILSRILPASTVPPILGLIISAASPSTAFNAVLAILSLLVGLTLICSAIGCYALFFKRHSSIRLSSPDSENPEAIEESWLSEFSQPSSAPISSFSYSPSPTLKTPNARHRRPDTANDESWLSSPTNSPATVSEWDLSRRTITSPESALTRQRSHSPIPESLPRPIQPDHTPAKTRRGKSSTVTVGNSTTSPGGSILGNYEPDPAHPLPRGFASLSSFPISPDQIETIESRSRTAGMAFVPEHTDPRASTWTLETYHTCETPYSSHTSTTAPATGRRAPPPPPIPLCMPLPPTPTIARSETAVEWGPHPKESREFLMGEREWVEVDPDVDGLDGWSRESRAVGPLALISLMVIYALVLPILVNDSSDTTETLYLISLLLPAPVIALASYLLQYKPARTVRQRAKQASVKSGSTTPSLALATQSSLSIPLHASPKLTPPNEKRSKAPDARWKHFLNPKPSVSNFGFNRPARSKEEDAEVAENQYRKTVNRRSTDVWIEMGHAVEGGNRISRTAEMLKPNPAMRMMSPQEPTEGVIKRLRSGVNSMLSKRSSGLPDNALREHDDLPSSPVAINITSPSKFERRTSALSEVETHEGDLDEGMTTLPSAEIQTATKGRMSSSPIFFCGRPGSSAVVRGEEGYDVDWLSAGVLPTLVPNIKIGADTRIGPRPSDPSRRVSQPLPEIEHDNSVGSIRPFRGSLDMATPSRHGHSRGYSSSVDFTSPNFAAAMASTPHARQRIKHKKSFSLPEINPADFADVEKSFNDCGRTPTKHLAPHDMGVDLPPVPNHLRNLSGIVENEVGNESSFLRETIKDMAPAILALSPEGTSPGRASQFSYRIDLADLAPIILHGGNLSASFSSSLRSEEEIMAEEMEQIMAMDTPTRTEFVISPPPSSYASSLGGRDSRSSLRTTRSTRSLEMPPLPVPTRHVSGWTTTTGEITTTSGNATQADTTDQFTDADEGYPLPPAVDISIDLPELRDTNESHGPAPIFAHPHPPPMTLTTHASMPNFSRPGAAPYISAHPPINLRDLKHKSQPSSETIRSDTTQTTSGKTPPRTDSNFTISQAELDRLAQLKERKEASKEAYKRSQSAMGHHEREQERLKGLRGKPKSQLRPLEIAQRRKEDNRLSTPLPLPVKRRTILFERQGENGSTEEVHRVKGKEVVREGKMSKASTGSGKENAGKGKNSKSSTGPVPKGLRA